MWALFQSRRERYACDRLTATNYRWHLSHHRLSFRPQDWLHGLYDWTVSSGHLRVCSFFICLHYSFCLLALGGRLSWLFVSFWARVNITYRIVYRMTSLTGCCCRCSTPTRVRDLWPRTRTRLGVIMRINGRISAGQHSALTTAQWTILIDCCCCCCPDATDVI